MIAVFDLDGTLYDGSTLKDYFLFGVWRLAAHGHIVDALRVAWLAAAARIGLLPHVPAKYAACRILRQRLTQKDMSQFVDHLEHGVRPEVADLAGRLRAEGYDVILSTASPEEYCVPLARQLGFAACHATPLTSLTEDYVENRGEEKVRRLGRAADEVRVVVTDHSDDLPLLLLNAKGDNVLVAPKEATVRILREQKVKYRVLSTFVKKD